MDKLNIATLVANLSKEFNKSEIERIVAAIMCGQSIDSAIQSIIIC